jgi:hypothetical protein
VLVVPGDLEHGRFVELTEAVDLAGLPDPSWLPDAVARAGEQLAVREAGTPLVVIDARRDEIAAWSVRTADDGVEIRRGGALDLTARLDALLSGVVYARLAVVEPELAESLRRRCDAVNRRDAAHLSRELREARRLMCTTDGEELIVTAGDAEVYLTRAEFTGLVDHALRDILADAVGGDEPGVATILVTDSTTPVVEHLADMTDATVLSTPAGATCLDGAAALVLPRPVPDVDATDLDDEDTDAPDDIDALPPAPDRRPPRWAVPALSTMLVLSLAGAATVLVTTPAPGVADAGVVSSVVPVLGHLVDPGR